MPGRRAEYWHPCGDGAVACELCPHHCRLSEGKSGLCKVRRNEGGELVLPYYGKLSALAVDPIEKKPLHHFLPGSSVFSAGFVGCNLRCPFCQNWRISQSLPAGLEDFSPEELVGEALRSGSPSIAYTYSESAIHFEFVREAMRGARRAGLKNVLVTNGCIDPKPARELLALTDAANVDLKTWSAEAYREELGGDRDAVLEFIRIAASLCLVEVTTLVVPGFSDDASRIASIADFLAGISPEIPLHLSAYYPAWKYESPPTRPESLLELGRVAEERLDYVYIGNVAGRSADTVCPRCGSVLIARRGYRSEVVGIAAGERGARCSSCSHRLNITL